MTTAPLAIQCTATLVTDPAPTYSRCDECGVYGDPARRHRCARLAPRELPDVPPTPARVALPPVDARTVVDVVLAWDAARDLDRLAAPAVLRHYYGRSCGTERAAAGSGAHAGPLDHLPARARAELDAIHRRFERLRHGAGRQHYAVLWYAFLETGPEQRYTQGALARHATGALSATFLLDLGRAFATPTQRRAWSRNAAIGLRTALPRLYARRLYDAAVAAYEGVPGESPDSRESRE